jgi:cytochrome c551/c552
MLVKTLIVTSRFIASQSTANESRPSGLADCGACWRGAAHKVGPSYRGVIGTSEGNTHGAIGVKDADARFEEAAAP